MQNSQKTWLHASVTGLSLRSWQIAIQKCEAWCSSLKRFSLLMPMSTTAAATSERFVLTLRRVPRCKNGQLSCLRKWVWSRWWLSRLPLWAVGWNRNQGYIYSILPQIRAAATYITSKQMTTEIASVLHDASALRAEAQKAA